MPKNDLNVTLKGIDELLFSTEEQRQEEKREQVQQIPIDELHPFTNHPFKVSHPHLRGHLCRVDSECGDFRRCHR